MGELQSLSLEGAFSEDEEPQTVFNFEDHFGGDFDGLYYQFELSKDECELRVRHLDFKKSTTIGEYLMTETTPGGGFTKIDQQPSTISDLLKDLGIKLQDQRLIEVVIQPLGETGYFLYHEEDRFHTGHHKVYLINTKRKCVDSIIISKKTWVPVVDQKNPTVFYLVNGNSQKRIEFDLFSNKKEPGALPLHLIFINYFIPMPGKFCTTYDIDEGLVTIYESFKAFRASKVLGRI
jgi:hypothetical protein